MQMKSRFIAEPRDLFCGLVILEQLQSLHKQPQRAGVLEY